MTIGKLVVTKELYDEWVKNKTKNPATGRTITLDGPTAHLYKNYGKKASASSKKGGGGKASKKGGGKASASSKKGGGGKASKKGGGKASASSKKGGGDKVSSDVCQEWEKIKVGPTKDKLGKLGLTNPLTGRRIIRDGRVYHAVDNLCKNLQSSSKTTKKSKKRVENIMSRRTRFEVNARLKVYANAVVDIQTSNGWDAEAAKILYPFVVLPLRQAFDAFDEDPTDSDFSQLEYTFNSIVTKGLELFRMGDKNAATEALEYVYKVMAVGRRFGDIPMEVFEPLIKTVGTASGLIQTIYKIDSNYYYKSDPLTVYYKENICIMFYTVYNWVKHDLSPSDPKWLELKVKLTDFHYGEDDEDEEGRWDDEKYFQKKKKNDHEPFFLEEFQKLW